MSTTPSSSLTHLAPTPTPTPPHFEKLSPNISLHTPLSHTAGHLIILCTWLGAQQKHIAKYISAYTSIASSARILLIQSDVRGITSSYTAQRKAIGPAVDVVLATLADTQEDGDIDVTRILLHTFSNGGPNNLTQLLLALHELRKKPLRIVGLICDSGPAAGEYWRNHNAMVLSLPPGISRVLGVPIIHGILILLAGSVWLGRYEKLETTIRKTLLSSEYVIGEGNKGGEGKRSICYVYSEEDEMTYWGDVVRHAAEARRLGWEVDEWCVEGTGHCNHFVRNVEGYVGRMRGMWEGGVVGGVV